MFLNLYLSLLIVLCFPSLVFIFQYDHRYHLWLRFSTSCFITFPLFVLVLYFPLFIVVYTITSVFFFFSFNRIPRNIHCLRVHIVHINMPHIHSHNILLCSQTSHSTADYPKAFYRPTGIIANRRARCSLNCSVRNPRPDPGTRRRLKVINNNSGMRGFSWKKKKDNKM